MKKLTKKKIVDTLKQKKTIKWFWIIVASPFALLIFLLLLTSVGTFGKLPSFEELENPKSNIATEIYSEDGQILGSFYTQNRSFVSYEEMSPNLVAALVSTEDMRFYSHSGIDFMALLRVAVKTVAMGNMKQGGGSTITQQLAKNLFPRDTTIYSSKISRRAVIIGSKLKEWITAIKLEHNYTKSEIIAMYLNTVEFGSNAYGIKTASSTFFNKKPSELNIEEAALLVGIVNAPTKYSPVRNPKNALDRRNTVISRMESNDYFDKATSDSLQKTAITLDYRPISHNAGAATYFRETLRGLLTAQKPKKTKYPTDWDYEQDLIEWENNPLYGWCEKNRRSDGEPYNIYRDGLKIYTTINSTMQQYAEEALWSQLSKKVQPDMDAQVKRTKNQFIGKNQKAVDAIIRSAYLHSDRYRNMKQDGASDDEIEKALTTPVQMDVFSYKGDRDTLMTPRDSIIYHKRIMRASFMAMDPSSGEVKAFVGGQDYKYFKYDMVKQGRRQVGSTMKPFIYSYAFEELGLDPCTLVPNVPTSIEDGSGDHWSPKEASTVIYDGAEKPLQWGLANSRNNYSAWIMKQSKNPNAVADFVHRLGITSYIDPVWSMCLGTASLSVYEMVASYCVYANKGIYTRPMLVTRIEDRHGNILASFTPATHDVISEKTSYQMLGMLKSVVSAGTAGKLRYLFGLTGEIGGKTGTTQDNVDAWYIGVAPKLVAGGWVGGEDQSVHFLYGGEGGVMALPIYGEFMKRVYADPRLGVTQQDKFNTPAGATDFGCASVEAVDDPSKAPDEFFD